MAHDVPITLYVEQETKDQLHREADDRGLSVSAYCHQLIDQARQADAQDELVDELNAEQRLLEIAATATEETLDFRGKSRFALTMQTMNLLRRTATRQRRLRTPRLRTFFKNCSLCG